ncbi:hypothetical protein [Rhizobium sp. LjRoot258]|uniref:hypothetical protein n=1 Tax=Rhizobium sp. LjRoot258 TaxID=3342299 RepID=UPI003ED0CD80
MKLRATNARPISIEDTISVARQPAALQGAWTFDFETGEIWWSEEVYDLHRRINGASIASVENSTRTTLTSWVQAVAPRLMTATANDRYELDIDIGSGDGPGRPYALSALPICKRDP